MDVKMPRYVVYALLFEYKPYYLNTTFISFYKVELLNLGVVGGVSVVECWLCVIFFWVVIFSPGVSNS